VLALVLAVGLSGVAGPGRSKEPTPLSFLPGGHGIALTAGNKAAAHALAEATRTLEAGRPREVKPQLERAAPASQLDDQIALVGVETLLALGDTRAALDGLERLERTDPPELVRPQIEQVRARALLARGDEEGARAAWRRAFEAETLPHRRHDVKIEMVEALQRAGRLPADTAPAELAPEVLQEASRPDEMPTGERSPDEAAEAGDALLARGRSAAAAEAYAEALAALVDETERRLLHQRRGVALFKIRRYTEARTSFESAGNGDEARFWVARAAAREGSVSEAMRIFAELGTSPDAEWASRSLYLLGTLHDGRDELDAARSRFEQVVGYTVFPERVRDALWRLGWADFEAGRFEDARAHFLAMVASAEAEGLEPETTRRARYWAARAGERGGAIATAKASRAELLALAHEAPFDYYGLRAQQRLGKRFHVAAPSAQTIAEGNGGPASVSYRQLQRAALLVEAERAELAALELRALAEAPLGLADRMAVGRVMVAAEDYAGAQRIVVDAVRTPLAEGLRPGLERLWWLAWPQAYPDAVAATHGLGVERELVWAIMREESSFRPRVHSSAGAIGLMQLMPETAARVARRAKRPAPDEAALETPEVNVELGTRYLAELRERLDGRVSAMIASYNAGPRAVKGWLEARDPGIPDDVFVEDIPYGQTRSYTRRVLRSYWLYQQLYD